MVLGIRNTPQRPARRRLFCRAKPTADILQIGDYLPILLATQQVIHIGFPKRLLDFAQIRLVDGLLQATCVHASVALECDECLGPSRCMCIVIPCCRIPAAHFKRSL